MTKTIGFIILRHVKDAKSGKFWVLSHQSIRKFYKDNKIIIIDDDSNYNFIDKSYEDSLKNTMVIKSEFPHRAELLPYYYYSKNKFFDVAVIVQDSVFINSEINFFTEDFKFLWHIKQHRWDFPEKEREIISSLNNNQDILDLHKSRIWKGCFGAMVSVNYNFLKRIDNEHDISKMIPSIKSRDYRIAFERVIACIFLSKTNTFTFLKKTGGRKFSKKNIKGENRILSYMGDIISYCHYGTDFDNIEKLIHLPIIKIWYGR